VAKLITVSHSLRPMLRKALDAATPTLREIAREAGVSYGAIRMYRAGQRTPSANVLRALVAALRKQSGGLAKLVDKLEATSKR
jgi:transcriptional regulator with XRE-family HTH domain